MAIISKKLRYLRTYVRMHAADISTDPTRESAASSPKLYWGFFFNLQDIYYTTALITFYTEYKKTKAANDKTVTVCSLLDLDSVSRNSGNKRNLKICL